MFWFPEIPSIDKYICATDYQMWVLSCDPREKLREHVS